MRSTEAPIERAARRVSAVGILLALAALTASCGGRESTPLERLAAATPDTGIKVLIVGIDGATLRVWDPLLAAGRLPTIEKLIASGSRGVLQTKQPTRSPALWTTIATGRLRKDHGIHEFLVKEGEGEEATERLVSSQDRRTLAMWNLLGPFDKEVGVAGWWATWPAEPVNGWIVSDGMTRSRWSEWSGELRERSLTFPPELADDLRDQIVDPSRPPMDEIRQLVEFSAEEEAEFEAVNRPIFSHGPSVFKFAYCHQRSYENMSTKLLAAGQPDLSAVFLIANDPISHTFWHFYEPSAYEGVDPDKAARLGELLPNFQEHNDRFIAELLQLVDDDTVVLIVADHGFRASGRVPEQKSAAEFAQWFEEEQQEALSSGVVAVGMSGRHAQTGVFIASGGPIRQGVSFKAELEDVVPTVLALLGMPVADDMPGQVLETIIEPEFLERFPVRRIESYEALIDRATLAVTGEAEDEDAMEMLRSLGYIQ